MQPDKTPDHGGGVDAAAAHWGGDRARWIDLSTGINPQPYPVGDIPERAWSSLPDTAAQHALVAAARRFWRVPRGAAVLAAPGCSALIAQIPFLRPAGRVRIPRPTYNEHARSFLRAGWETCEEDAQAEVIVHPNNPDGRLFPAPDAPLAVIDESFCDVTPEQSLIAFADRPGTLVLKGFGKFWGLAGLRLGFAIGDPDLIGRLAEMLGPWPVSGPALDIGTRALGDDAWAAATRQRLAKDAARLDHMMQRAGAALVGGTTLFRLYDTDSAKMWQDRLATRQIWTRIFPYSDRWIRLGLPGRPEDWARLESALT